MRRRCTSRAGHKPGDHQRSTQIIAVTSVSAGADTIAKRLTVAIAIIISPTSYFAVCWLIRPVTGAWIAFRRVDPRFRDGCEHRRQARNRLSVRILFITSNAATL